MLVALQSMHLVGVSPNLDKVTGPRGEHVYTPILRCFAILKYVVTKPRILGPLLANRRCYGNHFVVRH